MEAAAEAYAYPFLAECSKIPPEMGRLSVLRLNYDPKILYHHSGLQCRALPARVPRFGFGTDIYRLGGDLRRRRFNGRWAFDDEFAVVVQGELS